MIARRVLGVGAVAGLVAAGGWMVSGPSGAAPTELFSSATPGFTASAATVPAGICFVSISADGGEGGANGLETPLSGGAGANVTARVPVTPGATLSVQVGGAGEAGSIP